MLSWLLLLAQAPTPPDWSANLGAWGPVIVALFGGGGVLWKASSFLMPILVALKDRHMAYLDSMEKRAVDQDQRLECIAKKMAEIADSQMKLNEGQKALTESQTKLTQIVTVLVGEVRQMVAETRMPKPAAPAGGGS